jgi:hypothetical protein
MPSIDANTRNRTDSYIRARQQHPAWQLLASRRAPLVLSCLQSLFETSQDGIGFDEALQSLADMLSQHANDSEFEISTTEFAGQSRKELRSWIRSDLIIEREGRLYATDALEEALRFVEGLGNRIMTSTASRLSVVQREIESLEAGLNPDPASRVAHLRRKITELESQLADARSGNAPVLKQEDAVERIREIYGLAIGLRADFRRVEDSWREADRHLRQSIVSEQNNRGEIVDKLLDGHDDLLETAEGKVFHGFHQQLGRSVDLDNMKHRLRTILKHEAAAQALNRQQQTDLRWLVMRLVKESAAVIRARARSERDVKGFLKTGLAAEHHRVGALLHEIFEQALDMDWSSQALRRRPSPLPPLAFGNSNLPVVERLLFKAIDSGDERPLDLSRRASGLNDVQEDFWAALDGLDRDALVQKTLELLQKTGGTMSIANLAQHLPPTHDLESIALWLSMSREADVRIDEETERVDVRGFDGATLRFSVPRVHLTFEALAGIEWEL